ncbi:MAG: ATP-binding cassette domain-containing protein [Deltaproteobacteria bacterium]|nr:ATP-binding cassette domain-containing protein [Deltaproteobacteria bacterium]
MSFLALDKIQKSFGETRVLEDVSLAIDAGELIVLLGASGSGKSTLLRIVAGLEAPTSGSVRLGGEDVTHKEPKDRGAAMVFQSYALYPHMTVRENMGFALTLAKTPAAEREKRVNDAAEMLGLTDLLNRLPKQLSGGQRQRVAIGRAVVREPRLFLFDEPLSNLDAGMRAKTRVELKRLQQRLRTTALYVTHDQIEAMSLATRICLLSNGRVEQFDTPEAIYARPASRFVGAFIGQPAMSFFDATIASGRIETSGVVWPLQAPAHGRCVLGLRPQELTLTSDASKGPRIEIDVVEELGTSRLVHGRVGPLALTVEAFAAVPSGAAFVDASRAQVHCFDQQSGRRL